MDLKVKELPKVREKGVKRIKWFKLKDEECKREFKERVLREVTTNKRAVPDWWKHNAGVIRKWGKEILGETSGHVWRDKETWWWNSNVQDSVQRKRAAKNSGKEHSMTKIGKSIEKEIKKQKEQCPKLEPKHARKCMIIWS